MSRVIDGFINDVCSYIKYKGVHKEVKDELSLWNNVNKVDSKKRKNYTDINIASFWLGVRPLLCE